MVIWEHVPGIPWLVARDTDTGHTAMAPAPPPWASPELTEAVTAGLVATTAGYCDRCGGTAPAYLDGSQPGPVFGTLNHDPACPLSVESAARFAKECQPGAEPWTADMDALAAYLGVPWLKHGGQQAD